MHGYLPAMQLKHGYYACHALGVYLVTIYMYVFMFKCAFFLMHDYLPVMPNKHDYYACHVFLDVYMYILCDG